jgi:hypothetical protein
MHQLHGGYAVHLEQLAGLFRQLPTIICGIPLET